MGGAFMPSPPHEVHPATRLCALLLQKIDAPCRTPARCARSGRVAPTAIARLCLAPCPARASARQYEAKLRNQRSMGGENDVNAPVALGRRAHRGHLACARGVRPGSRSGSAERRQSLVPRRAVPGCVGGGAPPDASEEVLGATAGGKVYVF